MGLGEVNDGFSQHRPRGWREELQDELGQRLNELIALLSDRAIETTHTTLLTRRMSSGFNWKRRKPGVRVATKADQPSLTPSIMPAAPRNT